MPVFFTDKITAPSVYPVRDRIKTLALPHVNDWNQTLLGDDKV